MSRALLMSLLCGGLVVGVSSCQQEEGGGMEEMEETGAMEGEAMEGEAMGEQMAEPDTTAAALWSYLESEDYQANWELWPDKGELYMGQEPHGALLTTYLNSAAHQAVTGMAGSMPDGAIVVKENYMPDSTLAAVTVMYKSAGYDAEHNDWFWLKRLPDGTVEVQGRGAGCIACHQAQSANDYIFTGSLGGGM